MKKMKNFTKVLAFALIVMLAATMFESYGAKAAGPNDAADTSSVYKKLKKNKLRVEPNPKSKQLTLGYALAKIKAAVDDDPNGYYYEINREIVYTNNKLKCQYIAPTKAQRKALKWARNLDICFFLESGLSEDSYVDTKEGHLRVKYDGTKVLTRLDLLDLFQKVIESCYGGRIPYVEESGYNSAGEKIFNDTEDSRYIPILKGICIAQTEFDIFSDNWDRANLNAVATREDLSRMLKNLKIMSKYCSAKIVYREKKMKKFTVKDAIAELKRTEAVFAEYGLSFGVNEDIIKAETYKIKGASTISNMCASLRYTSKTATSGNFSVYMGYYFGGREEEFYWDPSVVDIAATIRNIIELRG